MSTTLCGLNKWNICLGKTGKSKNMFPLLQLASLIIWVLKNKIQYPNSFGLPVTFSLLRHVYVLMNQRFSSWFLEQHFQNHLVISLIVELSLLWWTLKNPAPVFLFPGGKGGRRIRKWVGFKKRIRRHIQRTYFCRYFRF